MTAGVFECVVCLAPHQQGRGYATEAVRALIGYCFDHLGVAEFRSYVSTENPRSLAIARRIAMRHEGRGKHPLHGDECEVYSVSRESFTS